MILFGRLICDKMLMVVVCRFRVMCSCCMCISYGLMRKGMRMLRLRRYRIAGRRRLLLRDWAIRYATKELETASIYRISWTPPSAREFDFAALDVRTVKPMVLSTR